MCLQLFYNWIPADEKDYRPLGMATGQTMVCKGLPKAMLQIEGRDG